MPLPPSPDPLAGQLAAEYRDLLPPALVETTVAALAASGLGAADQLSAEQLARADVAALAAAVTRAPRRGALR